MSRHGVGIVLLLVLASAAVLVSGVREEMVRRAEIARIQRVCWDNGGIVYRDAEGEPYCMLGRAE